MEQHRNSGGFSTEEVRRWTGGRSVPDSRLPAQWGRAAVTRWCLFLQRPQPHSGQRGGQELRAKTTCQLPPALLIRKAVASQPVPPGRFPLVAHWPELHHMATLWWQESRGSQVFNSVHNKSSNIKQRGLGGGTCTQGWVRRGRIAQFWL